MTPTRSCVCLLVILLVHLQVTASKPFFGWLFCDLFCDDDDITTAASTTADDDYDLFDCSDCPLRQPATRRPSQSITVRLPQYNLGLNQTDGVFQMVLDGVAAASGAPAVTATTPATTAAPANATTAAG